MYKIGILGGAFDPPHNGHIHLAAEAMRALKLKKLLIIPTGVSPHKAQSLTPFQQRVEMCRLAFGGLSGVEISEIEGGGRGRSYTIDTLRRLKNIYPADTAFHLIIGADMLFSFEKWYKYEAILKECSVVAAARENGQYIDMIEYAAELGRVRVLNIPELMASSSEARALVRGGKPAPVPESVASFIKEKELYR